MTYFESGQPVMTFCMLSVTHSGAKSPPKTWLSKDKLSMPKRNTHYFQGTVWVSIMTPLECLMGCLTRGIWGTRKNRCHRDHGSTSSGVTFQPHYTSFLKNENISPVGSNLYWFSKFSSYNQEESKNVKEVSDKGDVIHKLISAFNRKFWVFSQDNFKQPVLIIYLPRQHHGSLIPSQCLAIFKTLEIQSGFWNK